MNTIEIPLSKTRIIFVVIGATVFTIAGVLFLLKPELFLSPLLRNELTTRVIGGAAILFFGGVALYGVRKLFDNVMGLRIDDSGITDHTNASSVGLIEWKDITGIESAQVMSTKFLLIFVADPEKYLAKGNGFQRKLMQGNMKMYGTPLSITSTAISYDLNDLEKLLKTRLITQKA